MNPRHITLASLLLFFSLLAGAQDPRPPATSPTSPPPAAASQPPGSNPPITLDEPKTPPHRLTPEESKELLQSVDEIMRFASQDTLLPIKHSVKKAIVGREQVEKYLNEKFESDVDRIRFERSELVLKKFGLLPRNFELHDFLIKLLSEQVAGFYNEKSKTMNLLDWVDLDMQKPVMAHELTHALQDQSYDLEKISKMEEEIEKRGLNDLAALVRNDEESTCRTAVMEGQAMIVLLDYILAPAGRSVQDSPKLVEAMQASMEKTQDSPMFDRAPLLLQEELIFPYRQGMTFIKELLVAGGKKLAYTGVLDNLPKTTREILEPKEYLAGRRVPPLLLPDLGFLKKDYEAFDAGAVGEFDVHILLKVYAEAAVAQRLSPDWRGGAYYAAGKRGAKPTDRNSSAHIGLYYISKWASEASAREFAKIYASALPGRYTGLQRAAADPAQPGLEKYLSSDGPIFIQQTGDTVVVSESFDAETAGKLIKAGLKQAQESRRPAPTAGAR
ncbi:MAG TPA: hypothetical protein VKL40_00015 [Candidatus Angelobacter sp.]|nr:hypothetical protein [Candidatus Angelobacter sp.]